jgi:hypothetical protein
MQWRLSCVVCVAGLAGCDFPRPADVGGDASPSGDAANATMDGNSLAACNPTAKFGAPMSIPGIALASGYLPRLSFDELTIYFSAAAGDSSDLYVAHRDALDQAFGEPMAIHELSPSSSNESGPTVAIDGLSIFFASGTPVPGQLFTSFHLFVAVRSSVLSQFGPVALATVNDSNGATEQTPFLTGDGQELWFSSARDGLSFGHLWRAARVAGGFGSPVPVSELNINTANTTSIDVAPALGVDRLSVYFASIRPGGIGGFDIWMSHRNSGTDGFPAPQLVDGLNSSDDEYPGWLSPDNCRLYGSNRAGLFVATRQP